MKSRALRRHHEQRLKKKVEKWLKNVWNMNDEWVDDHRIGSTFQTPCKCSCWMCTYNDGLKKSNQQNLISFQEQLDELDLAG